MATPMAVFQDSDKCMRCNGCVLSCKRTWKMKADHPGVHKVAPDQRVVIKSQRRIDNGPFIRFSCWHCPDPPCVKRCPFKALTKQGNGAVSIDPDLCDPSRCQRQCLTDCQRAGYPKIGAGSDLFPEHELKAWKCTLCWGRAGSDADIAAATSQRGASYGKPLPRNTRNNNNIPAEMGVAIPELAHEPSCVYTCPAKAMKWGTRAGVRSYISNGGYISFIGDGSMYWASKRAIIIQPKADPYIEDHITPMVSNMLNSSFARAALVPTIFAGGLLAIIARRQQNMEESTETREG
jgi:Fe-S-cluster-containing dehydrogenase component